MKYFLLEKTHTHTYTLYGMFRAEIKKVCQLY